MKNCTTPRTLAECSFHVGYPVSYQPTPRWRTALGYVVLLAVAAGVGVLMAWRG